MTSTLFGESRRRTPTWRSRLAHDPVATSTGIVGLVTVGAIHWAQVVPTIDDTPYLGASFIVLTVACIALAGVLLASDRTAAWLLVGVVNALPIAGYVFTRTVSSFFDDQDVGNWSETLGMVALLIELLLIALTLYRLLAARARHRNGRRLRHETRTVDLRAIDSTVDDGNPSRRSNRSR